MVITTKEICFAISTFECVAEYDRCVKSLPEDSFIVQGDGCYPEFGEKWFDSDVIRKEQLFSQDGTCEVIHNNNRKGFVFSFNGWQPEKRQAIANKVAELKFKYMFIIDSDEYIHPQYNDWDLFLKNLEKVATPYILNRIPMVFDIQEYTDPSYVKAANNIELGQWHNHFRVWLYPTHLEYFNDIHWWIRRKPQYMTPLEAKRGRSERLGGQIVVDGVRLYHDTSLRTKRYLEARDHWSWKHLEVELKRRNVYLGFPENHRLYSYEKQFSNIW